MTVTFSFSVGDITGLSDDDLAVLVDTLECLDAAIDDRHYDYVNGDELLGAPPSQRVLDQMTEVEEAISREVERVRRVKQTRVTRRDARPALFSPERGPAI